MTALDQDRKLLASFLRELVKVKPPCHSRKLTVLEQQYPGEEELSEDDLERRGIPDGWIFNEDERWCTFIESKVIAKLGSDQINRHRRTAERLGFKAIAAVTISPRHSSALPTGTKLLEWRTVYVWLRQHASSSRWAARVAAYLEIAEAKLIDFQQFVEGTLTMFSGFPFGHDQPFTYSEGKRVLELALGELRSCRDLRDQLGMNPKVLGRPALTGRQSNAVWNFLSLSAAKDADNFTHYPHLTLAIRAQDIEAVVTVPNGVNKVMQHNLRQLGDAGFRHLVEKIVKNMKPLLRAHKGAMPCCRGVQRRYPSQRATPYVNANIEFDLRTAVPSGGGPKVQPKWLEAAYAAFVNKQHSNYQIQLGVLFPYMRCPELRQPGAIDLIAAAWLACKPLVDLAR